VRTADVASVTWGKKGTLYVQVQDRSQRALRLLRFEAPREGNWTVPFAPMPPLLGTVVIEERSDRWLNLGSCLWELSDGGLVWGSSRSGHHHLYRYSVVGECEAALTSGEWVIDTLEGVDEEANRVFFTCSLPDQVQRNLYSVQLRESAPVGRSVVAHSAAEALRLRAPWGLGHAVLGQAQPPLGSVLPSACANPSRRLQATPARALLTATAHEPTRLTREDGCHEIEISHDMRMFIDVCNSIVQPFKATLHRVSDGEQLAVIFKNEVLLRRLRPHARPCQQLQCS